MPQSSGTITGKVLAYIAGMAAGILAPMTWNILLVLVVHLGMVRIHLQSVPVSAHFLLKCWATLLGEASAIYVGSRNWAVFWKGFRMGVLLLILMFLLLLALMVNRPQLFSH